MKTFKYNAPWGETYELALEVSKYGNNGSLAIILNDVKNKEEFGVLTINLPQSSVFAAFAPNTQFVDTNNLPNIDEWLEENKIAKRGSVKGCSGFCTYPSFEFDLNAIK